MTEAPRGGLFLRVALPFLAGYFLSYAYRVVNAVMTPQLVEAFGLTAGGLGLLSSMYFLVIAFCQLPLGVLLDRYGPRRVNAVLFLIATVGGAGFALAQSAGAALAARALIGIGVSGALMSSFLAFVLWYPAGRISTLNGIAFSAGALGAMAASVPMELLLRVWHWREAFGVLVAASFVVCLALWFWVPERRAPQSAHAPGEAWKGVLTLLRDPGFRLVGIAMGASQFAAIALQTLWIAPWLRDVAGYSPAQVAQSLLAVNVAMIVGYLGFGRAADLYTRRGRSTLPLLAGGIALSSVALAALLFGLKSGAVFVWCVFVFGGTAAVLSFSLLARRVPPGMAGRANTVTNIFGFIGAFAGQWGFGLILDLWPRTATGYAPEGYSWALALAWVVQAAGLVWLWRGRRLVG